MAREQPLPHLDPPKIEPRPLSQAHDFAGLLGYAATNDDLTRFLSYAIAVMHACRPRVDDGKRTKVSPYWAGFTPRNMAAELARIIKQLRRAKRTGDYDHLRRKLKDGSRIDCASAVRLGLLGTDPPVPDIEAVQAAREACIMWPRGERTNPQWEAVRLAVINVAEWFWWLATPTARGDKASQQLFILAMLEAADFGIEGLRQHPERLYRDEIVGPLLALLLGRRQ
jgi:hypothetical protein